MNKKAQGGIIVYVLLIIGIIVLLIFIGKWIFEDKEENPCTIDSDDFKLNLYSDAWNYFNTDNLIINPEGEVGYKHSTKNYYRCIFEGYWWDDRSKTNVTIPFLMLVDKKGE